MPKHARRESLFFKELKKQDLHVGCDDVQLQKQNEDCDVEPDQSSPGDEVDDRPQLQRADDTQRSSREPCPAAAADDNDGDCDVDDDDVTGFTSLQSRMCCVSVQFFHPSTCLSHPSLQRTASEQ